MNNKILNCIYEYAHNNPSFLLYLKENDNNDILNRNLTDWEDISKSKKLDEIFIDIFQDFLSWKCICQHQVLTEDCLNKFEYLK